MKRLSQNLVAVKINVYPFKTAKNKLLLGQCHVIFPRMQRGTNEVHYVLRQLILRDYVMGVGKLILGRMQISLFLTENSYSQHKEISHKLREL